MEFFLKNPKYSEYFKEVVNFLDEHQFIFVHQNTHLLSNKIFDSIPSDWKDFFLNNPYIAFNEIAAGKVTNSMPESLKFFILRAQGLKPATTVIECPEANVNIIGVGAKKIHEIKKIAPIIHKICCDENLEHIIDIGCGVGYLSEFLSKEYGYKVLGLEGNQKFVDTAIKNQKLDPKVSYKKLYITQNSSEDISTSIIETFKNFKAEKDRVCLIALHGCADLSVDLLKIFTKIPFVKSMILMPCCYHRMQQIGDKFKNFPLSCDLKAHTSNFFNQPFLRLACQKSSSSWKVMNEKEHDLNARNCLFRNILQEVVDEEQIKISRKKRKTGSKEENYKINDFIEKLSESYCFSKHEQILGDDIVTKIKFEIKSRYVDTYGVEAERLIEGFTSLQMLLQSVCEGVVLMDRCAFVTNTLGFSCDVIKVTDEQLSPRCFALTITKSS